MQGGNRLNRIIALMLCAIMLLGLAGCAADDDPYVPTGDALDIGNTPQTPETPSQPQRLVMVYNPEKSLNPYTCTDFTNRALFSLLYQGLFAVDRDYNVAPLLCDRYSVSPDMKTYTFYPAAATFSDGAKLTAADVVASLNAAENSAYYSGRFQHISSIAADGDGVVIKLDTPCENLPLLLDIPIVKASQVANAAPLGTGPYIWGEALSGKCLKRTALWWCQTTHPITADLIPLEEGTSPDLIRDAFLYSDVSIVCTDPGSDTYADYHSDYEIWDSENGLFVYLVTNSTSPVFSIDSIRQTLTHAINRDLLVSDLDFYRGFARSATLPASPLSPVYNASLAERYGYDRDKFTAAVEEAGKTGAEIVMIVNSDDSLRLRAARQVEKMLEDCGLKVKLEAMGSTAFVKRLKAGTYDLYMAQTKLSANMDLSAFFAKKGSLNYGGLSDTATYTLCMEALANSGNFYNLHKLVMEDGQLCPILFRSYAIYSARGLVTDLDTARDNLFYYDIGKTMADALIKA